MSAGLSMDCPHRAQVRRMGHLHRDRFMGADAKPFYAEIGAAPTRRTGLACSVLPGPWNRA
jgi:hypothetical protein